jgi:hypothetical protein
LTVEPPAHGTAVDENLGTGYHHTVNGQARPSDCHVFANALRRNLDHVFLPLSLINSC